MPAKLSVSHVFFLFAVLFSLFLFRSPVEMVICGAVYAFVDAFVLPRRLSMGAIFPLSMLFLFLLILSETPERLYTLTLYYTVRLLIVFRSLLLLLGEIRDSEEKTSKAALLAISGFAVELGFVAVFLYSAFKPVDPSLLKAVGFLSLKVLLVSSIPLVYQRLNFKNGEVIG